MHQDYSITHLKQLESEAIYILRETAAQFEKPVLLFSGGKDSIVMAHLARKAFHPARLPFPLVHVDTGHNFPETLEYRDRYVAELRANLIVGHVQDSIDRGTVQEEKAKGKSILFGDVSSPDVLESAGIAEADALILTIPDENAVLRACAVARRRRPDLYIAARTRMASRATVAREIGATHVTTDEDVTAEAMADSVMRHIGACPLAQRGVDLQALTED